MAQLLELVPPFDVPPVDRTKRKRTINLWVNTHGGSTSLWALHNIRNFADRLVRTHVLFLDLSMGDTVGYRSATFESIVEATTQLVETIRALPLSPAIVYVETFPSYVWASTVLELDCAQRRSAPMCNKGLMPKSSRPWRAYAEEGAEPRPGGTRPRRDDACGQGAPPGASIPGDPCEVEVRHFPHWPALRRLDVPVISYLDAVCDALPRCGPFAANGSVVYWRGGVDTSPGCPRGEDQNSKHPHCDTHEVLAHVAAEFLSQALRETSDCGGRPAAAAGGQAETARDPSGGSVGGPARAASLQCLLQQTSLLEPPAGRPSSVDAAGMRLTGPAAFRGLVTNQSWVFAADSKSKYGWIAQPGVEGEIRFQVETCLGQVFVEYLRTYENIGSATCQAGSGPSVELEGFIGERVSISGFGRLQAEPIDGPQTVTCRSRGQKFKILSVRAC